MLKSVLAIIASLLIAESGTTDGGSVFAQCITEFSSPNGEGKAFLVECYVKLTENGTYRTKARTEFYGSARNPVVCTSGTHRTVEDAVREACTKAGVKSEEFIVHAAKLLRDECWLVQKEVVAEREAAAAARGATDEIDWFAYAAELTAEYVRPIDGQLSLIAA